MQIMPLQFPDTSFLSILMQKICIAFRLTFQIDKFYCQKPIIAEVRHQTQQFLFFCFQCNTIREICSVHRFQFVCHPMLAVC